MEDHWIFENYLFVVRGTLFELPDPLLNVGFVPVHTGNTESHGSTVRVPSVHPRVCGEHTITAGATFIGVGSSPLCGEHAPIKTDAAKITGSSPRVRGTLKTL